MYFYRVLTLQTRTEDFVFFKLTFIDYSNPVQKQVDSQLSERINGMTEVLMTIK